MSAADPIGALVTLIAAKGPYGSNSVALTADQNLFRGPPRPARPEVPPLSVFVEERNGQPPKPWLGIGKNFRKFQLQVTVRGNPGDYGSGEELARSILWQVQAQMPAGYCTCLVQNSSPERIEEDNERQSYWRFFVELWHDEP